MKLTHVRHRWLPDDTAGPVVRLRCSVCGRTKDAGIAGDRRAVSAAKAEHGRTSGTWSGNER